MHDLVTVPEAAKLLGVCRATAYNLIKRGELPHVKIGPKTLRVKKQAILDILEGDNDDQSLSAQP